MAVTRHGDGAPEFRKFFDVPAGNFGEAALKELAAAFPSTTSVGFGAPENTLPAGLTYFAQFVVHDVTFMERTQRAAVSAGGRTRQLATATLDLDCLYGPRAAGGVRPPMRNDVFIDPRFPVGKLIDLPRRIDVGTGMGVTDIADFRNDENFLVGRVHLLFLRLHNAIHARRPRAEETRRTLSLIYQQVVRFDLLRRLIDPTVFALYLADLTRPEPRPRLEVPHIPLEFAVAGMRFGHALPRGDYDLADGESASLKRVFELTSRHCTSVAELDAIRSQRFDWNEFLPSNHPKKGAQSAERLATAFRVDMGAGAPAAVGNIVERNLLRGDSLGLPSAQDLIGHLVRSYPALCEQIGLRRPGPDQLREHPVLSAASSPPGVDFTERTPLWAFVLAEPYFGSEAARNRRLGPLGSLLVAMTFSRLLRSGRDALAQVEAAHSLRFGPPDLRSGLGRTWPDLTLRDLVDLADLLEG